MSYEFFCLAYGTHKPNSKFKIIRNTTLNTQHLTQKT